MGLNVLVLTAAVGDPLPLTDTLDIVAVHNVPGDLEHTTIPTNIELAIEIHADPTCVHVAPSVERQALKVLPLRMSLR
jgi:hypothetical protein